MATAKVIPLRRREYDARSFKVPTVGRTFTIAGTLDGFLDFCTIEDDGNRRTVTLDCDEARMLASALLGAADDVQKNCMFDRDPRLLSPCDVEAS